MSISWGVIPCDPSTSGFYEWLQSSGEEPPALDQPGRYPTPAELLSVLETFKPLPVENDPVKPGGLWEVTLGEPDTSNYAYMLGSIKEDGIFHFHFYGSHCQETTMLAILQRLSIVCGPFAIFDHMTATPVFVTPQLSIDQAIERWNTRQMDVLSEKRKINAP